MVFTETLILPTTLPNPSLSVTAPAAVRALPGGLAEIHGAACPNVDAKPKNVRSKVTLKGERALGRAGAMGWRRHADALSSPQIPEQTAQIRTPRAGV